MLNYKRLLSFDATYSKLLHLRYSVMLILTPQKSKIVFYNEIIFIFALANSNKLNNEKKIKWNSSTISSVRGAIVFCTATTNGNRNGN